MPSAYHSLMIRLTISGTTATIIIDDPDRRNALSNEAMAELGVALRSACADGAVRVVVVTGAGDRAFCAGGDLSGGFVDAPLADHGGRSALADLVRAMRRCPKPIVARVNGHALGGGLGLIAACDIAVAADHARFGTPEIAVGLWPMMITAVLRPLVPRRPLLELMLTGRRFDAAEAVDLGIINRAVPSADLDHAVDAVVADACGEEPCGADAREGRVLRRGRYGPRHGARPPPHRIDRNRDHRGCAGRRPGFSREARTRVARPLTYENHRSSLSSISAAETAPKICSRMTPSDEMMNVAGSPRTL